MKLANLDIFLTAIKNSDFEMAKRDIDQLLTIETGPAWIRELSKLRAFLDDGMPRWSIFAKGNSKLPFIAFSALPGKGFCPGAGDCLNFCYSFKSWRYPAAFCRQVQNTVLLSTLQGRAHIEAAFSKFAGNPITLRLYVDGDFRNVDDVAFWFDLLRDNPDVSAYGYSKSFDQLLAYKGQFPENYVLNISGGHRHQKKTVDRVKALPITRGEFVAVPMPSPVKSSDHGKRDHQKALRAQYGRKAFTCPGKCGECTTTAHACGSKRFKDVDIIIAVH